MTKILKAPLDESRDFTIEFPDDMLTPENVDRVIEFVKFLRALAWTRPAPEPKQPDAGARAEPSA